MFIKINHPEYRGVELVNESLVIHSMPGKSRALQENVKDVVVAVQDNVVRIVAFLDQDYAWFLAGTKDLQRERIELGQRYGGGGRLVNDGMGNSHLFYFVKQSPGHSSLLRHQIFSEKWSIPALVSTNVFSERSSFSAAWHSDNYLHIAYCNHKDQHLLYRVYNLEHRMWSGAVPFSEQSCSYPQFISGEKLYLFWQEDLKQINLKVRHKDQNWSQATLVSSQEHHASNVGYAIRDDKWHVLWGEGTKFYQTTFDNWSERQLIERDDFTYAWIVEGNLTIPVYERKVESPQVETPPPAEAQAPSVATKPTSEDKAREKREREEAKLQAAFVEQAFRTLQEWESLREEIGQIRRWRAEFRAPEPVDLTPLTTRLERLERRFLALQQSQEQIKKNWETSLDQVQQDLGRVRKRLHELEEYEKKRQVTLWRRVLGRG